MGYSTDFTGHLTVSPALTPEQVAYLQRFNETRRMQRQSHIAETLPDPVRLAAGLPIGAQGGYYVGIDDKDHGQTSDPSVTNYNHPPAGQPSLWCQWTVSDDGTRLMWDGGEKFYSYIDWLEYLIENFFIRFGRTLNGEMGWMGEDRYDIGMITVVNNKVSAKAGEVRVSYPERSA